MPDLNSAANLLALVVAALASTGLFSYFFNKRHVNSLSKKTDAETQDTLVGAAETMVGLYQGLLDEKDKIIADRDLTITDRENRIQFLETLLDALNRKWADPSMVRRILDFKVQEDRNHVAELNAHARLDKLLAEYDDTDTWDEVDESPRA